MKRFEASEGVWSTKMNWVDENNLLVGFDYDQCCCENFGYYYSVDGKFEADRVDLDGEHDLDDYVFDPSYHIRQCCERYEDDAEAVFMLINHNHDETSKLPRVVYLHIYNSHNGYYSHGFEFCNGETVLFDGSL